MRIIALVCCCTMMTNVAYAWQVQVQVRTIQPTAPKEEPRAEYVSTLKTAALSGHQAAQRAAIAAECADRIAQLAAMGRLDILEEASAQAAFEAKVTVAAADNAERGMLYASANTEGYPESFMRAVFELILGAARESRYAAQAVEKTVKYGMSWPAAARLSADEAMLRSQRALVKANDAVTKVSSFLESYKEAPETKALGATKSVQGLLQATILLCTQTGQHAGRVAESLTALADACGNKEANISDAINKTSFVLQVLEAAHKDSAYVLEKVSHETLDESGKKIVEHGRIIQEKTAVIIETAVYALARAATGSAKYVRKAAELCNGAKALLNTSLYYLEPLVPRYPLADDQRTYIDLFTNAANAVNQAVTKVKKLHEALTLYVAASYADRIQAQQEAYDASMLAHQVAQAAIKEVERANDIVISNIKPDTKTTLLIRATRQAGSYLQKAIIYGSSAMLSVAANAFGDAYKCCDDMASFITLAQASGQIAYTIADSLQEKVLEAPADQAEAPLCQEAAA